jgi:membrane protease YdiL (CAAX protease family)
LPADQIALLRASPRLLAISGIVGLAVVIVCSIAGLDSWSRLGLRGLPWSRRLVRQRDPAGPGAVRWLGETAMLVAGSIAWSCLVFRWTGRPPEPGEAGASLSLDRSVVLGILIMPMYEQLMFRLGLQGVLARLVRTRWSMIIAVVVAAALWSELHARDERVLQLLPIGLGLGWLQLRHGAEACITAHVGFDASMLWLAPILWPA